MAVIGSLARGGSERQLVELVRSAHPSYARFSVVCLGRDAGELADEVRGVGADVHTLGFTGWRVGSLLAPFRLARILRRERPDVVYAFLFWGYTLALPVAAVAHPRAVRVAARRSTPEGDVSRAIARPLRRIADAVTHAVVANVSAVADAWIATSPHLRDRMHVIPNGVPIPALTGPAQDASVPVVICVANLIGYKGHATLLEAASLLRERGVHFRLLLVGDGPERPTLEASVDRQGLRDCVDFLGRRADVGDLLAASHVAVLASHTEGLPNAVLEAMAAGRPVVATSVGGTPSLLSGGAGTLVAPHNPRELADALQAFLSDPGQRETAGRIGRATVEDLYSVPTMRDATLRLFHELMESRGI